MSTNLDNMSVDGTILLQSPVNLSRSTHATLTSTDSYLDDALAPLVIMLKSEEQTIGRDRENSVCLSDMKLSRQHIRVYPETRFWWVEDLNSHNGLHVNGHLTQRAQLKPGDIIQIGSIRFTFELEQIIPETSSADLTNKGKRRKDNSRMDQDGTISLSASELNIKPPQSPWVTTIEITLLVTLIFLLCYLLIT